MRPAAAPSQAADQDAMTSLARTARLDGSPPAAGRQRGACGGCWLFKQRSNAPPGRARPSRRPSCRKPGLVAAGTAAPRGCTQRAGRARADAATAIPAARNEARMFFFSGQHNCVRKPARSYKTGPLLRRVLYPSLPGAARGVAAGRGCSATLPFASAQSRLGGPTKSRAILVPPPNAGGGGGGSLEEGRGTRRGRGAETLAGRRPCCRTSPRASGENFSFSAAPLRRHRRRRRGCAGDAAKKKMAYFNSAQLAEKLVKLTSTQAAVETLSQWCLFNRAHAKAVVQARCFFWPPARLAFFPAKKTMPQPPRPPYTLLSFARDRRGRRSSSRRRWTGGLPCCTWPTTLCRTRAKRGRNSATHFTKCVDNMAVL